MINIDELKKRTIKGREKKVRDTIKKTEEEILKLADSGLSFYTVFLYDLEEEEREEIKRHFEKKGLKVRKDNDWLGGSVFVISWE